MLEISPADIFIPRSVKNFSILFSVERNPTYNMTTKDRRSGLDELVKAARAGKFKILLIYSIDRLARDTRHLLNLIHELNLYGVSLISIRESIDFSTPMGQATLTLTG
jgi:DNA invertase Pin-like site-specific DNA recombinase